MTHLTSVITAGLSAVVLAKAEPSDVLTTTNWRVGSVNLAVPRHTLRVRESSSESEA